jgi:ankyrin repeat protein
MLKMRFGQLRFVLTCLLQDRLTPLHHACSEGHVEVVTVLVRAGAQIDAQDRVWTVEIRVDLSSSVSKDSPPSCLRKRSCGGRDCVGESRSSNRSSRLGLDS